MRGVTAAIPGNHPPETYPDYPITPGGTRRSRLTEFWEGTTDVEDDKSRKRCSYTEELRQDAKETEQLSQLVQAAASAINVGETNAQSPTTRRKSHLNLLTSAPPATAPSRDTYHASDMAQDDYFGNVALGLTTTETPEMPAAAAEVTPEASESSNSITPPQTIVIGRREAMPFSELGTVSVPAVAKRISLMRQISSPLPAALPSKESRVFGGRIVSDTPQPTKTCRLSKEEQLFDELQYLVPPDPPDELERRRALYK